MSIENPLWGAPRIHGELLMLGIKVAESTLGSHREEAASAVAGLENVPAQSHRRHRIHRPFHRRTISFKLLYGLVILRHARRRLVTVIRIRPSAPAAKRFRIFPCKMGGHGYPATPKFCAADG
jgi:hypothetical protein